MTKRRFIAWVMALAMIFQMLPATVLSEGVAEEAPAVAAADVIEVPAVEEAAEEAKAEEAAEDEPVTEPEEKAFTGIGSNQVTGAEYATVSFAVLNGEEIPSVTVAVGETLAALPELELPEDAGWFFAGEPVDENTIIEGDMEVALANAEPLVLNESCALFAA